MQTTERYSSRFDSRISSPVAVSTNHGARGHLLKSQRKASAVKQISIEDEPLLISINAPSFFRNQKV